LGISPKKRGEIWVNANALKLYLFECRKMPDRSRK
jgi:hypothetical protein